MKSPTRQIFKHGFVFGFGFVLMRLGSLLMLPIYTNYLSPADYGVIAILDLSTSVFAMTLGDALTNAVTRFHYERGDDARSAVWWTGLIGIGGITSLLMIPLWALASPVSELLLGDGVSRGGVLLALALGTCWCEIIDRVPQGYFLVNKWSRGFVIFMVGRFFLNIGLSLTFVLMGWGVFGVLLGHFLSALPTLLLRTVIAYSRLARPRMDTDLLKSIAVFAWPLILCNVFTLGMRQTDRYLLRLLLGMTEVGLFSLAATLTSAMANLISQSFRPIWGPTLYEIADAPDAPLQYARVFEVHFSVMTFAMLGVSLFARFGISLVAAPEFAKASSVMPFIALACLFHSTEMHFAVPALVSKRTVVFLLPAAIGWIASAIGNIVLIPTLGLAGAGIACAFTLLFFSASTLLICRRYMPIRYPARGPLSLLVLAVLAYALHRSLVPNNTSLMIEFGSATVAILLWTIVAASMNRRVVLTLMTALRTPQQVANDDRQKGTSLPTHGQSESPVPAFAGASEHGNAN